MTSRKSNVARQIGLRIKVCRLKNRLTQEELASRAGLHRTYVGSCERGERNITILNLARICDALEISLKTFFESGIG